MANVVAPKPSCRKCGAPVRALHRCPRCGRRAWAALLGHPFWVRY